MKKRAITAEAEIQYAEAAMAFLEMLQAITVEAINRGWKQDDLTCLLTLQVTSKTEPANLIIPASSLKPS